MRDLTSEYKKFLKRISSKNEWDKFDEVNTWFNQMVLYKADKGDYWQTLNETIKLGYGDCDDYAIAKFYTLISLGIKPSRMRLHVVSFARRGGGHMVLMVDSVKKPSGIFTKGKIIVDAVLDNMNGEIERYDSSEIILSGIWFSDNSPVQHPNWLDMQERMKGEKLIV